MAGSVWDDFILEVVRVATAASEPVCLISHFGWVSCVFGSSVRCRLPQLPVLLRLVRAGFWSPAPVQSAFCEHDHGQGFRSHCGCSLWITFVFWVLGYLTVLCFQARVFGAARRCCQVVGTTMAMVLLSLVE